MAMPYELGERLETVGRTDFGGPLPNGFTAHPKTDPATGEVHGFGYALQEPYLVYVVVSADGRVRTNEPISLAGPASVHDFALTERHAVFPDLPVVLNMDLVAQGFSFPFRWDPSYASRVGVMPREGTDADVRWFDVEPCYVFHVLNAYDVVGDDGDIEAVVMDVLRYERMFEHDLLGPSDGPVSLDRWTIDLVAGVVREERLDDRRQEFPRVDPRLLGTPHRYGYAVELGGEGGDFARVPRILKHDLQHGTVEAHDLGPGRFGSEAVFVPDGPDAEEDEGWLVSFVLDADRGASDLVVVAAQDMGGPPVAVVELPVRVPFGFHGCWVPNA
jgi:carotenoid cleavage dioxygenase